MRFAKIRDGQIEITDVGKSKVSVTTIGILDFIRKGDSQPLIIDVKDMQNLVDFDPGPVARWKKQGNDKPMTKNEFLERMRL